MGRLPHLPPHESCCPSCLAEPTLSVITAQVINAERLDVKSPERKLEGQPMLLPRGPPDMGAQAAQVSKG